MRAIDTNIVARFLLRDDPHQYDSAKEAIAGGVLIPATVLLELGWLLSSRYSLSREVTAAALTELIDLPTVTVEHLPLSRWAIQRYADGADFADMVHVMTARSAQSFVTFDASIAARAGPDAPIPIETLS